MNPLSSMQALWGWHESQHHFWGSVVLPFFFLSKDHVLGYNSLSIDYDVTFQVGELL